MSRDELWYIRGGRKNGGRFGYLSANRFLIGLNHRPMTRNARARSLRLSVASERREGRAR